MKFVLPYHGETRIVKRFPLFPIEINLNIYWLQLIKIQQRYDVTKNRWINEFIID